ncbi:MAG: hypothetical protein JETCAE01_29120 [Anaerolineaceae bacterium]|nr:MAG: hypothetical protein JETCAE01_29120 [Anaerolineaceae bacterium]
MKTFSYSTEYPTRRFLWVGTLFMVFARFLFAALFQGLTAVILFLRGDATPIQSAAPWWTVYGSLIDIACLISIAVLMRGEGLKISSLLDFHRDFFWKDVRMTLLLIFIFLVVGFIGGTLAGILIYGGPPPAIMGGLPLWGTLYSLIIWPALWGFTEQLTYQGYVLPRLRILTRKTWLMILLIAVGFAMQHTVLPLVFDWKFILFRAFSSLPLLIMVPIYLRTKRLTPFMIAHWGVDMLSVVITIVM